VDENYSYCAFARRYFVFVGPAAVVGEGLALEKLGIIRRGLVDQHEQDFAAHVEAFVVVPVVFRRFDSVADKNNFGIDIRLRLLGLVEGDVFVKRLQVHGLALPGDERELSFRQSGDADQRNLLHVGAVIAGGLETVFGKLGGDVFGGNVAAALSGTAALQQIVRQVAHVPANVFGCDGLKCDDRGAGQLRRSCSL